LQDSAEPSDETPVFMLNEVESLTVKAVDIGKETTKDNVLSRVREYVIRGWPYPENVSVDLKPFYKVRVELSVVNDCILRGSRVIVPTKFQQQILSELHVSHPGMSRMKGLARSYVWWPTLDKDIELKVQGCTACQENMNSPTSAPIHPWEFPSKPWQRLHMDFAGPFMGHMFLVVIDAYSKWIECVPMKSSTSAATIGQLRGMFSTHGLPEVIVTDNATCFISEELQLFFTRNGIEHITVSPYHPAGNGLAERAVQTVKNGLKLTEGDSVVTKLQRFLFNYRLTPHTTTGVSPSHLLMNRKLRSQLDYLYPHLQAKMRQGQRKVGEKATSVRSFGVNDLVGGEEFHSWPEMD